MQEKNLTPPKGLSKVVPVNAKSGSFFYVDPADRIVLTPMAIDHYRNYWAFVGIDYRDVKTCGDLLWAKEQAQPHFLDYLCSNLKSNDTICGQALTALITGNDAEFLRLKSLLERMKEAGISEGSVRECPGSEEDKRSAASESDASEEQEDQVWGPPEKFDDPRMSSPSKNRHD